jgi:hypothetical protein
MIETTALPPAAAPRPRWLPRLTWVNWRQHRATLIGLGLFAALIAGYMLIAGLKAHNLYNAGVRDGCVNPINWAGPCRPILSPFSIGWPLSYGHDLTLLLPLLPIAIGVFLGAPLLAREYAAGTTRFAWTQSAGRIRLTLAKVALLGLVVLAVGALAGWLCQWSMEPVVALSAGAFDRWQPGLFVATPVTAAAAAGLAYAFGVLAGVTIRHVVPAMAVTAVATIVFANLTYNRLHFWLFSLGQHQSTDEVLGANPNVGYGGNLLNLHEVVHWGAAGPAGAWLNQGWYAGPDGHRLSDTLAGKLVANPGLQARLHTTFQVTWQPGDRYWLFQFAQGGAEVLLALLLGVLAIWLIRRRKA